jgi:zinc transport system substrate-binding protein
MKQCILAILLSTLAISCHPHREAAEKPVISVSILPQEYFLKQLAGNLVEINVMIPPGASPATYEPTVAQLGKLEQSASYFKMGYLGFELSWMDKIRSVNPEMTIVDLSKGVELIDEIEGEHENHHGHSHGGIDPHLWLSVTNARIISRNIHRELLHMYPDQEEELTHRYEKFSVSLDSLQEAIHLKLDGLEDRNFMIYHPALTYFARDYQLVQHSLEIEGKTPSPAHLRAMTDLAREHHITRILIQDQFDRKNAQVLAQEIGGELIEFDPLDPNWMDQMLYIADQFTSKRP